MQSKEEFPIFIVGCSRSGITLLYSILAKQSELEEFPETNILYQVLDDIDHRRFGILMGRKAIPKFYHFKLINFLGWTNSYPKEAFENFIEICNRLYLLYLVEKTHIVYPKSSKIFRI